jgi:hypothetical protein
MAWNFVRGMALVVFCGLTACAHSYYYVPEIDGQGDIRGKKGGSVYSIPAEGQAELTMRVRYLGIKKIHDTQMLGIRMSFVRPAKVEKNISNIQEFVDPGEQTVKFGDTAELKPAFVNPSTEKAENIQLNGREHEVIELFYPLANSTAAVSVGSFEFQWKVHFGNGKSEQQTARFDRYDAAPQQAADMFFADPDYPYDVVPMEIPGWQIVNDPYWWALDPWQPWW